MGPHAETRRTRRAMRFWSAATRCRFRMAPRVGGSGIASNRVSNPEQPTNRASDPHSHPAPCPTRDFAHPSPHENRSRWRRTCGVARCGSRRCGWCRSHALRRQAVRGPQVPRRRARRVEPHESRAIRSVRFALLRRRRIEQPSRICTRIHFPLASLSRISTRMPSARGQPVSASKRLSPQPVGFTRAN